jgi:DNA-binding MarR family transcriptional regulator
MAAMATAEQAEHAASRARTGLRRAPKPRAERAQDAKVDIGCLPRFLGYNLRRAHLCVWRKYVALIGENNIRPGLFSALVLVGSNPGIAQIELGRHLGVDKASMVALLDRLEKAGLLDRQRSTRDRRRQGIFLTDKGVDALQSLIAQVRTLERQIANRFTRAELDQFLGFLQRLYA